MGRAELISIPRSGDRFSGTLTWDVDRDACGLCPSLCDFLGIKAPDGWIAAPAFRDRMVPADVARVHSQTLEVLETGGVLNTTYRVRDKFGRWVMLHHRGHVLGGQTGERQMIVARLDAIEDVPISPAEEMVDAMLVAHRIAKENDWTLLQYFAEMILQELAERSIA